MDSSRVEADVSSLAPILREPLSDEGHIAITVYISILGCVATVGNVTVLLVLLGHRRALWKMQNVLLLNMAVVDLLVTLTAYPLTAVSSVYKRWIFGDVACEIGGFLVFMLSMVSMDTLTFIAVFRYILVCKPKHHQLLKLKNSHRAVLVTWIHSFIWTALPLLGWSRYVPEPFLTACSLDWTSPTLPNLLYIVFTLLTCYVVHVSIIVFCYLNIWRVSRRLTFGVRGGSLGGGGGAGRRESGGMMKLEEVLWRHKVETERSVTRMCAVMVAAYLLCWTPYTVLSLLAVGGVYVSTPLTTFPTMFAKLSCALNPVIYALMSSKFRRGLKDTLTSLRHGHSRGQNRVATTEIELRDDIGGLRKTTSLGRASTKVREYRGDVTNQGVYIGHLSLSLEARPSVF